MTYKRGKGTAKVGGKCPLEKMHKVQLKIRKQNRGPKEFRVSREEGPCPEPSRRFPHVYCYHAGDGARPWRTLQAPGALFKICQPR